MHAHILTCRPTHNYAHIDCVPTQHLDLAQAPEVADSTLRRGPVPGGSVAERDLRETFKVLGLEVFGLRV